MLEVLVVPLLVLVVIGAPRLVAAAAVVAVLGLVLLMVLVLVLVNRWGAAAAAGELL